MDEWVHRWIDGFAALSLSRPGPQSQLTSFFHLLADEFFHNLTEFPELSSVSKLLFFHPITSNVYYHIRIHTKFSYIMRHEHSHLFPAMPKIAKKKTYITFFSLKLFARHLQTLYDSKRRYPPIYLWVQRNTQNNHKENLLKKCLSLCSIRFGSFNKIECFTSIMAGEEVRDSFWV